MRRFISRARRRLLHHGHSAALNSPDCGDPVSGPCRIRPGSSGLIIAFILLLVPALQDAVDLANNLRQRSLRSRAAAEARFQQRIPADCTTLVAVPSLLLNEDQVHELVNDLEVRFLANRDPNLHFALLTDLPDAVSEPRDKDSHPLVELAVRSDRRTQCEIPVAEEREISPASSPPRVQPPAGRVDGLGAEARQAVWI